MKAFCDMMLSCELLGRVAALNDTTGPRNIGNRPHCAASRCGMWRGAKNANWRESLEKNHCAQQQHKAQTRKR